MDAMERGVLEHRLDDEIERIEDGPTSAIKTIPEGAGWWERADSKVETSTMLLHTHLVGILEGARAQRDDELPTDGEQRTIYQMVTRRESEIRERLEA